MTCLLWAALALAALPAAVVDAVDQSPRKGISTLDRALDENPSKEALPWLYLYEGELRRLEGDATARSWFEKVAGEFPDHKARGPAIVGMAVIDSGGATSGNDRATLELFGDEGVPDTLNADRYLLLAKASAREGNVDKAQKLATKAKKYASDNKDVEKRVEAAMEGLSAAEAAPDSPGDKELQAIEAIRTAIRKGEAGVALSLSEDFQKRFPASLYLPEIAYAILRAQSGVVPVRDRVAVLLPLTGTYAPAGKTLKTAMEMAQANSHLELLFVDTAGEPSACVGHLENAVVKKGASIVVGPLLKDETIVCAPAAQALHVPMLTLTSWEEATLTGDQIFRPYPSTVEQVQALLKETSRVRGYTRYAILYPQTPYGENATKVFEEQVLALGGTVAQKVPYKTEATDFRPTAKLLGKKDTKERSAELARLRAHAKDPSKVTLPPLVDYDAIFIPDTYRHVALLASALAFEEFPVGSFKPHPDLEPIPLLGLSGWNNDDLVRRGGIYVHDSIFVDAFDPGANDLLVEDFSTRFQEKTGAQPTALEAVAYDVVKLLEVAVMTGTGDLGKAILSARLQETLAGTAGFEADRTAERSFRVLTITREGIVPVTAATPVALPPPQ